MDKSQAFNTFWNSFIWKAYEQTTIPENTALPYISYEYAEGAIGDTIPLSASLWVRSQSWSTIEQKAHEISAAIGLGGKVVDYDGGKLWITRGATFAQRMSEPEDSGIRRILININAEFLSAN